MIEILAAVSGAMIGVAGMSTASMIKRSGENREIVTKLAVGVEHIGEELTAMRTDMKEDRQEIFSRLQEVEHRVTVIEAQKKR